MQLFINAYGHICTPKYTFVRSYKIMNLKLGYNYYYQNFLSEV